MGLFTALDAIVHGGIHQPESYAKKQEYEFAEELGKVDGTNRSLL